MKHKIHTFLLVTSAFYSVLVMGSQNPGAGNSRKRSADQLAPEETQPEKKPKKSSTPEQQAQFWSAIRNDALEAVITHLADFPEDIDLRTGRLKSTPLMWAIDFQSINVFPVLLKRTSDDKIEMVDSEGKTALFHAVFEEVERDPDNHAHFVKMLLERGANVNANNGIGEASATPLMQAFVFIGNEIIKLLLDYGADPNEQNADGDTAFTVMFTVMLNNISSTMNELLVDNPYSNHYRSLPEDVHTSIQLLLDHGMNVNAMVGNPPMPLLFIAIEMGIYEAVETLIARGADINSPGRTVLEKAQLGLGRIDEQSEYDQMKKIIQLLSNPLKLAILQGNLPAVQKIIEKSPDQLNAQDEEGDTPLMFAIRFKNMAIKPSLEIIKALAIAGTKQGIKNQKKFTALDLAKIGHQKSDQYENSNAQEMIYLYERIIDLLDEPFNYARKLAAQQYLIQERNLPAVLAAIIEEYQDRPSSYKKLFLNNIKDKIRTNNHSVLIDVLNSYPEIIFATDENKDTPLSLAIKYEKPLALEIIMQIIKDKVPSIIEGIDTRIAQLKMQMKFGRIDRYQKLIQELDEKKDNYRNVLNELESSELRELAQTVESPDARTKILNIIDHYNRTIVPMDASESASSSSSAAPIEPLNLLPHALVQHLTVGNKEAMETIEIEITAHPEYLNGVDKHGNTPLMIAAEHGNQLIVETLFELGTNLGQTVDTHARNGDGKTALEITVESLAIANEPARRARLQEIRAILTNAMQQ